MSFVLAAENIPFAVALVVMVGIGLLEAVAMSFGAGFSHLFDTAMPSFDLDADGHVDVDLDVAGHHGVHGVGPLSSLLGWLHVGRVPLLMLLVIFLLGFGLAGYFVQSLVNAVTGMLLPGVVAVVPAFALALPIVRVSGNVLRKVMVADHTEVVSEASFIGRVAVVTLGVAKRGQPAQAKLKDKFRHTHYVMVEPENDDESIAAGTPVLLLRRAGPSFRVTSDVNPALLDESKSQRA